MANIVRKDSSGVVTPYIGVIPISSEDRAKLDAVPGKADASALATTNSVVAGKSSKGANYLNAVEDFGMVADARWSKVFSMPEGTTAARMPGEVIAPSEVGKAITVLAGGPNLITGVPAITAATPSTSNGRLAAATYSYIVTAFCGAGESAGSAAVAATTTGTTGLVTLTWTMADKTNVVGYRIYGGAAGFESLIGFVNGSGVLTFVDDGQRKRTLGNTAIQPPTINCSPSNLLSSITLATNNTTMTLANAPGRALPNARSVTDATIGRTVTDAAITTGTQTLTSATASFSALDKGMRVAVTGAGSGGGILIAPIDTVTNSTTVTLGYAAGTTVSGATGKIYSNVVNSPTADFTAADMGKVLFSTNMSPAYGSARIYRVISATKVLLEAMVSPIAPGESLSIPPSTACWGTDNTAACAAIKTAITTAAAKSQASPYADGYGQSVRVHFPSGQFFVTGDNPFVPTATARVADGLHFSGAGRTATQIIYGGASTPSPNLLRINNNFRFGTFSDFSVVGLDSTATFLYSTSDAFARDNVFDKMNLNGRWYRGFGLDGNVKPDTNSEWSFNHCGLYGRYEAALMDIGLGTYNSVGTNLDQEDQFLNYWFNDCQVELAYGDGIRAHMGGNISAKNGSWFYSSVIGGTMVQLLTPSHGFGVPRFKMESIRFEPQRSYVSRMTWCEWSSGVFSVDNFDSGSGVSNGDYINHVLFDFNFNNVEGPTVEITNSRLAGRSRFYYGNSSYQYQRRVVYRNCHIFHTTDAGSYIDTQGIAGASNSSGSYVPVQFENCRGASGGGGWLNPFNVVYQGAVAAMAQPQRRVLIMNDVGGGMPGANTTITATLPRGSIITGVRLFMPAGAVANAGADWDFKVQTAETTPKVLCQASGGGTVALSAGFNSYVNENGQAAGPGQVATNLLPMYTTYGDTTRFIRLVTNANVGAQSSQSFCVIDYIA